MEPVASDNGNAPQNRRVAERARRDHLPILDDCGEVDARRVDGSVVTVLLHGIGH